jgi:hypothetical protein
MDIRKFIIGVTNYGGAFLRYEGAYLITRSDGQEKIVTVNLPVGEMTDQADLNEARAKCDVKAAAEKTAFESAMLTEEKRYVACRDEQEIEL